MFLALAAEPQQAIVRVALEAYRISVNSLALGEWLLELFLIHHVFDDHHFRGGKFFFRFFQDEP